MNKILATILETPAPKGITTSKIESLIQEVAEIDTNPKLAYSARGERILKELDKFGVKNIPQNYRGVLLEHWLELLSQNQENITESPEYQTTTTEVIRPAQQNSTTLTNDQLENLEGDLERVKKSDEIRQRQRDEVERGIKAKEQIAKQQKISTLQSSSKNRYEEIEIEQTQIKTDIQEAQSVQNELEDKKIYAKITVPTIPELTQEEKQDLQILEDFAKDPKTRIQLIEDLTQEIEERIKPTLKEATENEIKIIARTSAVDIVEKIANTEARQQAQEESIQTAVYQSLATNPKAIKEAIKETKPLQALEKGSVVLAYYANQKNATTQIIADKLFDSKFKQIFYGPDYKEIRVEYIEKPIQGQINYTVDIGAVNREFIGIQQKQNTLLEKVKSLGIEKTQTYFSNQAGLYIQKTIDKLPAKSVIKQAYSNPVLQRFLSQKSQPIVLEFVGQSRVVGVLSKYVPQPVLSIAGKALGIEIVKPVANKVVGQVTSKVVTQATGKATGASLGATIGAITGLSGGPLAVVTAAVGALIGEFISKVGSKLKVWWTKNKETIAPLLAVGAGLSLARFGMGPAILGGAGTFLMFGGTASALLLGPLRFFAIFGRNIGITIATPVIVTLLILPPLVAFIMLVINNSAYVVPYSYESRGGVGIVPEACLGEPPAKPIATNVRFSNDGKYAFPVAPFEAPGYACYHWDGNKATDIFSPQDKPPLLAYESGVITNVTLDDEIGGKYIIMKGSTSGRYYYYAHLCHVFVKSGESVNVGDVIGSMDETGSGRVQHLHYAINKSPLGDTFIGGDGNVCPQEDFEEKFGFNVCSNFCVNP